MTDDETETCALCGEPLDAHENPETCPVEGEDDEPSGREIRENVVEELADAHAAVVVTVQFPREDGVDELDYGTASFAVDEDMSETELVASKKLLDDGLERLTESMDESPSARAMAVPAGSLGQLLGGAMGGGSGNEASGDPVGFQ